MRALGASALAVLLLAGACTRGHPASIVEASRVQTTTTSTTAAPPPPTTTTVRIVHASRSLARPRPQTPVAAQSGDCGAWGWHRSRAQSDACWGPLVASYGDWSTSRMLGIMWCESHGDPWAKNPHSSAAGLFQILGASQGDGPGNIALAHGMWSQRGTAPWRACGG